jgi:hypothetical protein
VQQRLVLDGAARHGQGLAAQVVKALDGDVLGAEDGLEEGAYEVVKSITLARSSFLPRAETIRSILLACR